MMKLKLSAAFHGRRPWGIWWGLG